MVFFYAKKETKKSLYENFFLNRKIKKNGKDN